MHGRTDNPGRFVSYASRIEGYLAYSTQDVHFDNSTQTEVPLPMPKVLTVEVGSDSKVPVRMGFPQITVEALSCLVQPTSVLFIPAHLTLMNMLVLAVASKAGPCQSLKTKGFKGDC